MPAGIVFVVACVILIFEGVLLDELGFDGVALQSSIAIVAYLGLRREFVLASWTLVFLLIPFEWMTGGPLGLYTFGTVGLFLILRALRVTVQSGSLLTEVVVGAGAAVVHGLLMVFALLLITPDSSMLPAILWQLPLAAFGGAILTPAFLRATERVDERLRPSGGLRFADG